MLVVYVNYTIILNIYYVSFRLGLSIYVNKYAVVHRKVGQVDP